MEEQPATTGFRPCASIPGRPWYCAFTYPQRERTTEQMILADGHSAWFPLERFRRVNRQTVDRAVFPRYVFTQSTKTVIRDRGLRELARLIVSPTTREPLVVPLPVMRLLWDQTDGDGFVMTAERYRVEVGDVATVMHGPFVEFRGICTKAAKDRVWLLMDALGRKVPIAFLRENVELAA